MVAPVLLELGVRKPMRRRITLPGAVPTQGMLSQANPRSLHDLWVF